ncbi:MAG: hypothetical protein AAF481_05840 [Acidobacteriota bacterium]
MADARVEIGGQEVPVSSVGTNHSLNFGRFERGEITIHRYWAMVPRRSVVLNLEAKYLRLVRELQNDDHFEPSRLSQIGYPPLEEVLLHHPAHISEIVDHLGRDLLSALFPFGAQSCYVINSIDGFETKQNGLTFRGRCFEFSNIHPNPV